VRIPDVMGGANFFRMMAAAWGDLSLVFLFPPSLRVGRVALEALEGK